MTKKEKQEKSEAKKHARKLLRRFCRPGRTVYTILRNVSRSGMSRRISLFTVHKGEIVNITGHVARALDYRLNSGEFSITVHGCGSDVGFDTVHNLSYALHGMKDRGDAVDAGIRGVPFTRDCRPGHYRAGYSLRHEWM